MLASIPEPLPGGATVPPAAEPPVRPSGAVEGDTVAVPVPAPTAPLGDRPGTAPLAIPPPAALPAAASAESTAADTCWRVQVVATAARAKAEGLAEAAGSLLLLPATVERDGGLYKVRVGGCFAKAVADSVCRRARLSGFEGAFRLAAPGKP